ncbi:MAG TPA: isochorismatase family cysteine hydrolase [Spirochaetota bacterium]|nr:isochorismatase family cysteine hydrolase [Spirochaetota bacterium]
MNRTGLMIVDMQNYYLQPESPFSRYFDFLYPGSLDYIRNRANDIVIPNIIRLKKEFAKRDLPVIYLRLCGEHPDRLDLHRFFQKSYEEGLHRGYSDVYPLKTDKMSDVIEKLKPSKDDIVFTKTTFSPFSTTVIEEYLLEAGVGRLVMTGLATSQCVETTGRDASERGFEIIQLHDAQADYDEITHNASLLSSRGVCGGALYDTALFIEMIDDLI